MMTNRVHSLQFRPGAWYTLSIGTASWASTTSEAPEGRHEIARGVNPWINASFPKSPVRAAPPRLKLVPQVTVIIVHLMHLQELNELLLECPFLVMGLLVFNVMSHRLNL